MARQKKSCIDKLFPVKDITKLKELAKEGIMLYPLLISSNDEDVRYAIGVLQAHDLVVGRVLARELKSDSFTHPFGTTLDEFIQECLKLNMILLDLEELRIYHLCILKEQVGLGSCYEELEKVNHEGYSPLDEGQGYPLPLSYLRFIRYIQQDGKI